MAPPMRFSSTTSKAALELEAADVVDKETDAAEIALVAGVFRHLVAIAIDGVVLVVAEVASQPPAGENVLAPNSSVFIWP
jgi:hypothetical protein